MANAQESVQQKIEREMQERRELIAKAIADVPQANIDLMCVVIAQDTEKRSASFWLSETFVYIHKYTDRLRKYAAERKENVARKENEALFAKYIALTPPKSATELLTLMQRFGIAPQVPIPSTEQTPGTQTPAKAA